MARRIRIECPSCEKAYTVPRSAVGESFPCECGQPFVAVDPKLPGQVAGRIVNLVVGFLVFAVVGAALMLWHVTTHRYWAHTPMAGRWAAVGIAFVACGIIGEQAVEGQFARLFGRRRGRGA